MARRNASDEPVLKRGCGSDVRNNLAPCAAFFDAEGRDLLYCWDAFDATFSKEGNELSSLRAFSRTDNSASSTSRGIWP